LDGNKFDAMPVVVFKMTTLKDLSLSNCSILEIPPAIGVLSALEVLRLTANKLVTVPFEITTLGALLV
jgi:Leucine-rich repeat (LRR) protein